MNPAPGELLQPASPPRRFGHVRRPAASVSAMPVSTVLVGR